MIRRPREADQRAVDTLYAAVLRAGEDRAAQRRVLGQETDPLALFAVLRRAVPVRLLEAVAGTPPFSDDRRLLAGVALNPRTPRPLALRLLDALYWHDLADVAISGRVAWPVRQKAEALLAERTEDLRLGERIALARMAPTRPLLRLLDDADLRVVQSGLRNPRLRTEDLVLLLRRNTVRPALPEAILASARWRESYPVRLAVVLQPKTPLALALAQLTSLLARDLEQIAATESVPPLVQLAARRAAAGP